MDSINLNRVQPAVQMNTTSHLMLEIWSRAQTRIIEDLHKQAHRREVQTWKTLQHDTAKFNLLNRLSTAIMSAIVNISMDNAKREVELKTKDSTESTITRITFNTSTPTTSQGNQQVINVSKPVTTLKRTLKMPLKTVVLKKNCTRKTANRS